jgi:hypothetical protein
MHRLEARAFSSPRNADNAEPRAFRGANVTRRAVFGLTAGIAAAPAAAIAASRPRLDWDGRAAIVRCGASEWRIDPEPFGPKARLTGLAKEDTVSVSLTGARLAGTSLVLDFAAEVSTRGGEPRIAIQSQPLRLNASADFAAWVNGEASLDAPAPKSISIGGAQVSHEGSRLALRPDLSLRVTGRRIRLGGPQPFEGVALVMAADAPSGESFRHLVAARGRSRGTRVALEGPIAAGMIKIGSDAGRRGWRFDHETINRIEVEAFDSPTGPARVLILEGRGAFCAVKRAKSGRAAVRLEQASLILAENCAGSLQGALAGRVQRASHTLDFGHGVATVSGSDEAPFHARLERGRQPDISTTVRLEKLWLPLAGARAEIAASGQLLKVVMAAPARKARSRKRALTARPSSGQGSILLTGPRPMLVTASDDLMIRVRRSVDLLDLTFRFTGFNLQVSNGEAYLYRRGAPSHWVDGQVRVDFPAQHIAEEKFDVQDPKTCSVRFPTPVQARMSAPSRIVFSDKVQPGHKPKWISVPLTVEALTDWSKLSLEVHPRALSGDAGLMEQLALPGITKSDTSASAMRKIAKTLTAPSPNQTALELSGRLIFSPSSRARFVISPPPEPHKRTPLFHARLDEQQPADLRAIWSRLFKEGRFPTPTGKAIGILPMTDTEHWEIVEQTSVYGLPAMRRLRDPSSSDQVDQQFATSPNGSVVRPDGEWTYIKALEATEGEGGVFVAGPFQEAGLVLSSWGASLEAEWRGEPPLMLKGKGQDADGNPMDWPYTPSLQRLSYRSQLGRDIRVEAFFKGYLMPLGIQASFVQLRERRFFHHAELNSVFAYIVQRTFIVSTPKPKSYPAVSQPYLGRDFPARSVVMQTLRSPDLVNPLNSSIPSTISTTGTVDETGRVRFPKQLETSLIFWPRVNDKSKPGEGDGDVEFKWAVDGDDAPVKSNLLFISQSAMMDPAAMGPVAAYYKGLKAPARKPPAPPPAPPGKVPPAPAPPVAQDDPGPSPLRIARLDGQRRTYAAPRQEGDTAFDSHTWVMSTRGRINEATDGKSQDTEFFDMDGRMNGADQPPFYPWIERADIDIQSVDRLIGKPQGPVTVSYLSEFTKLGFERGKSSEIYLAVEKPAIALDVGGKGDSLGAVARPNTYVAALSRVSGIVGGTVNPSRLRHGVAVKALPAPGPLRQAAGDDDYIANFKDARDGIYNPGQMFGKNVAVIMGFIDLSEVIPAGKAYSKDTASRAFEKIGYGPLGQAEDQAIATIKAIVAAAANEKNGGAEVLIELQKLLETPIPVPAPIRKAASRGSAKGPPTGRELYPDLYDAVVALKTKLAATNSQVQKDTLLTDIARDTSELLAVAKALVSEIDRIRRDPVPPLLHKELDKFAGSWALLRSLATDQLKAFGGSIGGYVRLAISAICKRLEAAGMGPAFWGVSGSITCDDIIEDPSILLATADPLFERALARPLAAMLIVAQDIEMLATARVATARALLQSGLEDALSAAAERLRPLLHPPANQSADHILNASFRHKLAVVTADATQNALKTLVTGGGPQQVVDNLTIAYDTALKGLPALKAEIDRNRAAFPALSGDVDAVIAAYHADTQPAAAVIFKSLFKARIDDALDKAKAFKVGKREEVLQGLLLNLTPILAGLRSLTTFAQISSLGYNAQQWCHQVGAQYAAPMLAFADDAMGGLMGPATDMADQIASIEEAVDNLTPPADLPADLKEQYEAARIRIKAANNAVSAAVLDLLATRKTLSDWRKAVEANGACPALAAVLDAVRAMIDRRTESLAGLKTIAAAATDLKAIIGGAQARPGRAASLATTTQPLDELTKAGAALTGLITSIDKAGLSGPIWTSAKKVIADLKAALATATGYVGDVQAAEDRWSIQAGTLRDLISKVDGPVALGALVESAQTYVRDVERELMGAVLECVALPPDVATAVMKDGLGLINSVATLFGGVYTAARTPIDDINTFLHSDIIELILKGQTKQFDDGLAQFNIDQGLLGQAAADTDLDKALGHVESLLTGWSAPGVGVALVVASLVQLVGDVLRGKLTSQLNLDPLLDAFTAKFKDLLEGLVPTRIDLRYDWGTEVSSIDSVFGMKDPADQNSLVLDAAISVDLITGKRSSHVTGTLKPFWIQLFGSAHVATVRFKAATFTSVDGSAPDFDVKVDTVEMGPLMTFLKPLQDWLAPKGSGFYVKPSFSPVGIEAGYIFDAGIIQVATLTFINVSFGVAARLPFGPDKAEFDFFVGQEERPFLISSPPYGGGGYVVLTTYLKEAKKFTLGFGMGAVAAIKFGPLTGQGRIMAFMFITWEAQGWTIGARFEAVGEGNIACFAISVYILVQLIHSPDGEVKGSARYSFSFSVGFFKVSYSFTANYALSKGGGSRIAAAAGLPGDTWDSTVDHGATARKVSNTLPRKSSEWTEYRKRFATKRLEPAA